MSNYEIEAKKKIILQFAKNIILFFEDFYIYVDFDDFSHLK